MVPAKRRNQPKIRVDRSSGWKSTDCHRFTAPATQTDRHTASSSVCCCAYRECANSACRAIWHHAAIPDPISPQKKQGQHENRRDKAVPRHRIGQRIRQLVGVHGKNAVYFTLGVSYGRSTHLSTSLHLLGCPTRIDLSFTVLRWMEKDSLGVRVFLVRIFACCAFLRWARSCGEVWRL